MASVLSSLPGDSSARPASRNVEQLAPSPTLPISPLVGEMPGRAEVGAKDRQHQSPALNSWRRRRRCRSPPLWGRCPAGQRGALSRRPVNHW
ncbi:MAG: hypothetical protein E5Y10_25965 [Mesorhizobium sp.]|nr:MAG: hypothetical protein E5Y13_26695 [Mesorhizobium sp.]TJU85093.1 MAG: hypothetical protein E5Y10_25965 [Mesorhizobium sp.]